MKILKVRSWDETPLNFTGIVEHSSGNRFWLVDGELHREDGPACERFHGTNSWFLNGIYFKSKEGWFKALTDKQKENALWSVDLWG